MENKIKLKIISDIITIFIVIGSSIIILTNNMTLELLGALLVLLLTDTIGNNTNN